MSLAILIPYRPDSPHRERIKARTSELWRQTGFRPIYCGDGLDGPLFSFSRAVNYARAHTFAEHLIIYNADALPLSDEAIAKVWGDLMDGVPWIALFDGQQRFTPEQTERLVAGEDPASVGPAEGQICPGREALLGIRADVFDALRGMDERFIGWGFEDFAFHLVLQNAYPNGCDKPEHGLFQSLWHPDAPRTALQQNQMLWGQYREQFPQKLLPWYLGRP